LVLHEVLIFLGSAIHVLVSQLKDLFGIKTSTRFNGVFKIPKTVYDIIVKLDSTNVGTLVVSIACIIYIVIFKEFVNPRIKKRCKMEFPSDLVLVNCIFIRKFNRLLILYFIQIYWWS
jgi:MFS superfamily sulfate permease-like transporter